MANYIIDPTTGILIPTPGVDPGPDYATNVSNALAKLSSLTHTGPSNLDGYQIPSAGINFNADISAQSNNLTSLRSTRYTNQSNTLNGSGDIDCLYFKTGDLWINNGAGIPVQVTGGSAVNVSASPNYPTKAITNNFTINSSDGYILISANSTSNVITVTLPLASSVTAGRFYQVKDRLGTSETHAITINPAGSDTIDLLSTYVLSDKFGTIGFVSDGVSNWLTLNESNQLPNNVMVKGRNAANSALQKVIGLDSNNQVSISQSTSYTQLNGGLRIGQKPISSATYFVDTTTRDIVLLVDTTSTAVEIDLPSAEFNGRILFIKDVGGNATTNNITVVPYMGGGIEGLVASKTIQTSYGSMTLISDGDGNWWMI